MNTVCILEGPDLSGKTTLANWLVKENGFQRWHEGPPPKGRDQLAHYGLQLWRALKHPTPVILDRFHCGEMVYGPVKRDNDTLGYYGLYLLNRAILATGTKLFLCLPEWETIQRNWLDRNREEYLSSLHQLYDVYHRYQALYYAAQVTRIFNYEKTDAESWYREHYSQRQGSLPAGVIGSPIARYLIVGDQANQVEMDWPFFASGNSSRFLNECLWEAGFEEKDMAFVNSTTIQGKQNNLQWVASALQGLQKVIALGDLALAVAKRDLRNHAITKVEHPAYWNRFHSKKRSEYVQKLKGARG
jgi:thymidylate kinase